jgi:hypothetical protein
LKDHGYLAAPYAAHFPLVFCEQVFAFEYYFTAGDLTRRRCNEPKYRQSRNTLSRAGFTDNSYGLSLVYYAGEVIDRGENSPLQMEINGKIPNFQKQPVLLMRNHA